MSLTVTNGGQVVSAAKRSKQAMAAKAPPQKGPAARVTDRLEWSSGPVLDPEKKALLELLRPKQKEEKSSIQSMSEFLSEQARVRRLCARIAARIRAGDRVPMKDRRYLKARDPLQYAMATLMQKPNDDPKRRGTLLKAGDTPHPETSAPAAPAEAPAAPACAGSLSAHA